jgi:hypothetical protein
MGVPARYREPARSGEAGGPPGRRLRNSEWGLRIENQLKISWQPENEWRNLNY